ncbi:oncoprotein-induced transcript 3 protein-like [Saccostrea echinata]|uniref:oncoprotein-induced transcript 3 protein-like n=1 Tax=Saccostrea echinata TaxID=191078 RepID=UPI002A82EFBB|nr:oncoprotein-induced transcript 3 protein-like [Saccostrea echinata]
MNIVFMTLSAILLNIADSTFYCNTSPDPCSSSTSLFEPFARTRNCPYETKYSPCDRYITPGWYKSDDPILDQCPTLNTCGAIYPVWMNDSLPNIGDLVITKKLCKTGFSDCCSKEYDIQIKNCGSFYVYCIPALDACPERICFGTNGSCEYPVTATPQSDEKQSKEYKQLEAKYIGAISAVIVLVCLLSLVSVSIFYYIMKKRKRECEVKESVHEPCKKHDDNIAGFTTDAPNRNCKNVPDVNFQIIHVSSQ